MRSCRSLAVLTLLLACQPSSDGETDGTDSEGAGDDWGAPDCATVELPGPAEDVAATPRADRDAEVLALTVSPYAIAAPQDTYDIIAADLAAIRALDPTLADVHPTCDDATSIEIWIHSDDLELVQAISLMQYKAWDCHNERFGVEQVSRIDGIAFRLSYAGVFGSPLRDLYASLPGLSVAEGVDVSLCDPFVGCQPYCREGASAIVVEKFEENGAGARQYHFTREDDGGDARYLIEPGQAPVLIA